MRLHPRVTRIELYGALAALGLPVLSVLVILVLG